MARTACRTYPHGRFVQRLLGWVIGIMLCHQPELLHGEHLCAMWPEQPDYWPTLYPEHASAERMMARRQPRYPDRTGWHVRPYYHWGWAPDPTHAALSPQRGTTPQTRRRSCPRQPPAPLPL